MSLSSLFSLLSFLFGLFNSLHFGRFSLLSFLCGLSFSLIVLNSLLFFCLFSRLNVLGILLFSLTCRNKICLFSLFLSLSSLFINGILLGSVILLVGGLFYGIGIDNLVIGIIRAIFCIIVAIFICSNFITEFGSLLFCLGSLSSLSVLQSLSFGSVNLSLSLSFSSVSISLGLSFSFLFILDSLQSGIFLSASHLISRSLSPLDLSLSLSIGSGILSCRSSVNLIGIDIIVRVFVRSVYAAITCAICLFGYFLGLILSYLFSFLSILVKLSLSFVCLSRSYLSRSLSSLCFLRPLLFRCICRKKLCCFSLFLSLSCLLIYYVIIGGLLLIRSLFYGIGIYYLRGLACYGIGIYDFLVSIAVSVFLMLIGNCLYSFSCVCFSLFNLFSFLNSLSFSSFSLLNSLVNFSLDLSVRSRRFTLCSSFSSLSLVNSQHLSLFSRSGILSCLSLGSLDFSFSTSVSSFGLVLDLLLSSLEIVNCIQFSIFCLISIALILSCSALCISLGLSFCLVSSLSSLSFSLLCFS